MSALTTLLGKAAEKARQLRMKEWSGDTPTYYHATKQDLDEFIPGYNDGLTFLTPDSKFANNWLGKGKYHERIDGSAEKAYEREYKKLKDGLDKERFDSDPEYLKEVMDKKRQLRRDELNADKAIYPVKTSVKNTFHPEKDLQVMEDYVRAQKAKNSEQGMIGVDGELDWYRDGNYAAYETPGVVNHLRENGFDSMMLKESAGKDRPYTTMAVFDPENIRSINAKFEDPTSKKILASLSGIAAITQNPFGDSGLQAAIRPENRITKQGPKTFTEITNELISDGLTEMGFNKHRSADNAEMLNMIAGFNPVIGAIQLGSDLGHYAKKGKDYVDNNYLFGNPLFDE